MYRKSLSLELQGLGLKPELLLPVNVLQRAFG